MLGRIQLRITLSQAFRVYTCWNLGLRCLGLSLGRLLPFLVKGPMVFNVPHISEPCEQVFEDLSNLQVHAHGQVVFK